MDSKVNEKTKKEKTSLVIHVYCGKSTFLGQFLLQCGSIGEREFEKF